jgi:2-polyprenyl-3-methyl-5-hydroxy-6-metoxy-1,4-benzoquinol methylase
MERYRERKAKIPMKKFIYKRLKLHRTQERRLWMGKLAQWFPDVLVEPPMRDIDGTVMSLQRAGVVSLIQSRLDSGLIRGRVLDVGAGTTRYFREMLESRCDYQTTDCFEDSNIDVVCEIYKLTDAFGRDAYDTVLCLEVLEHLENPRDALAQLHAVLKPGGHLVMTTPLNYPIHTTEHMSDYWRFTEHGLRLLLKDFADVDIQPHGHPKFPYGYSTVARK